jgi:hypothetical protein
MFKPWIGPEYEITRLLILGESAYSWSEDGEPQHPSPQHSKDTVEDSIDSFPDCTRFFAMISRALANEESPTQNRLQFVWNRVAFTNYISETVGVGARVRPTLTMWADAQRDFLADVSKLKPYPKRLIVLGKTLWSRMPNTQVFITDDVQGYRWDEHVMMCNALYHPAAGLSWRQLASVIHFTYEEEFRA